MRVRTRWERAERPLFQMEFTVPFSIFDIIDGEYFFRNGLSIIHYAKAVSNKNTPHFRSQFYLLQVVRDC